MATALPSWLKRRIPALDWLVRYESKHLRGDALAGVIVATLLIPQAMAYALLAGLPPQFGLYASLLPLAVYALLGSSRYLALISLALTISLIGFLENISVAKALAAKRRQKVDSDQEFIALGAANLAAGFTEGYPVSGSFARSTINFTTGANTGLASLITVGVVGLAALFLSLYFANAKYIEDFVLSAAERPQLSHLVLICNAINFIDASALETPTDLRDRIQDAGIELYLTEVKGPVMDRLAGTEFLEQLGSQRVFLTTEEAFEKLASSLPQNDERPWKTKKIAPTRNSSQ